MGAWLMEGVVYEHDSLGVAYRGGVAYWNKLSGMMGAWLMRGVAYGILVCKGAWLNGMSVVCVSTDRVSLEEGAWPNTHGVT